MCKESSNHQIDRLYFVAISSPNYSLSSTVLVFQCLLLCVCVYYCYSKTSPKKAQTYENTTLYFLCCSLTSVWSLIVSPRPYVMQWSSSFGSPPAIY